MDIVPQAIAIKVSPSLSDIVVTDLEEILSGIYITEEVISLTFQIIKFLVICAVVMPV